MKKLLTKKNIGITGMLIREPSSKSLSMACFEMKVSPMFFLRHSTIVRLFSMNARMNRSEMEMPCFESASSRAERLARMLTIWNRIPSLDEVVAKIDSVNLEEVRDFARNVIQDKKPALSTYGPVSNVISFNELTDMLVA